MKFRPFSNPFRSLNKNQVGAVSIYVSFVIMTVLTLIALTFAKIMSDHYVEIAESQYDLQAHYAAESAISSVRSTIHKGLRDREQVSGAAVEVTVDATDATKVNVAAICNGLSGYGASLDIAGDLLAVGATDGICLLTKTSDAEDWSASLTLTTTKEELVVPTDTGITPGSGANLGASVALNPSGNLLAVGASGDRSSRGSVYIFQKQADASWSFKNKIVPYSNSPDEGSEGRVHNLGLSPSVSTFGTALVWHGDKLLVGVPRDETVYLLQENNTGWQSMGSVNGGVVGFGSSLVKASIRFPNPDDGVANFAIGSQGMIYLTRIVGDSFATTKILCSSCFSFTNLFAFYIDGGKLVTRDGSKVEVWERQGSSQWDKKYEIGNFSPATKEEIHVDGIGGEFGRAFVIKDELLVIGDSDKIHFLTIKDNNILKDIWAAGLDQDCPAQEDAHESWRNNTFGEVANISYTCVSVEVDPTDLIYDHVGLDRSLVLPLEPTEGKSYDDKQLESLSFYWNHDGGGEVFRAETAKDFPQVNGWNKDGAPVLRVQITAVNHSRAFSRDSLVNNTRVFFLYPSATDGGTQDPTDWPQPPYNLHNPPDGKIIKGYCDSSRTVKVVVNGKSKSEVIQPCGVTINMPLHGDIETADSPMTSTGDDKLIYFVRLQSIYQPAQLNIRGKLVGDTDAHAHFKNIQAVITATGWSNNVAERIRERIPLRPVYDLPEYGIDSAETLCKILVTTESEGVYLDNERDLHTNPSCSLKVED